MSYIKEAFRKFLVNLKRNPNMIPLTMLLIAFLYYSLNLTNMSDTTAKIQATGMGLAQFTIMLFSLLGLMCQLNAYPPRKKANVPMLALVFVMLAIILYADWHYSSCIIGALNRAESPIVLNESTIYIANAYNMLSTHMILLIIGGVLSAALPVYSKWLKKINTSVEVEDNGDMAAIELND